MPAFRGLQRPIKSMIRIAMYSTAAIAMDSVLCYAQAIQLGSSGLYRKM